MSTINAGATPDNTKPSITKPEKPDEASFKAELEKLRKALADAQEATVRSRIFFVAHPRVFVLVPQSSDWDESPADQLMMTRNPLKVVFRPLDRVIRTHLSPRGSRSCAHS